MISFLFWAEEVEFDYSTSRKQVRVYAESVEGALELLKAGGWSNPERIEETSIC